MVTDINHHSDEIATAQDDFRLVQEGSDIPGPVKIGESLYLENEWFGQGGVKKYAWIFDCLTSKPKDFIKKFQEREK
jgi:hypothetical protein